MEDKKLKIGDLLLVGSALFGLYFGAGNLIFPAQLGQEAGMLAIPTTIGFLITAVGLPFLGILAIGMTESSGLYELASKVGHHYGVILTALLYLTIGPLFSLPRTGSVAFEIAFASYLPESLIPICLFIFTSIFFGVAYYFSTKPSKIVELVGKYLNPIFLLCLSIVIAAAILFPMGDVFAIAPQEKYVTNPLFSGVISGYDTMDGLASLAFGIIIIQALKNKGVNNPKSIAREVTKSGVVVLILMIIIYVSLIYIGGTSLGIMDLAANGGIILALVTNHYFGLFGAIILALIVIFACLKTAIGLITACAETFAEIFPKFSYQQYIIITTLTGLFVANLGLTSIIELAKPVLMFVYPLSISLILLALIEPLFKKQKVVYVSTTIFVMYASLADGIATLGKVIGNELIAQIGGSLQSILPFSTIGMGWIIPAIIGFIIGSGILYFRAQKQHTEVE